MGTYYHCALVHGRVLIWWTDNDGTERQAWLEGDAAKDLIAKIMPDDFEIQLAIRAALAAAHKDAPTVVNNPDGTVHSIAGVVVGLADDDDREDDSWIHDPDMEAQ